MFLRPLLKSKKGSTLMLCIMIIIVMSLLGVSLMTVTISSMKMSIFYNDLDKAYALAEACAEEIISNIDQKVADIQEKSRELASEDLKVQLKENPISLRDPEGNISLASTDNENVSRLEEEYKTIYFDHFYEGIDWEFSDVYTFDKMKELLNATEDDGSVVFKDLAGEQGRLILKSLYYDDISHAINMRVGGLYNGYEKELDVVISLLAEPDNTPYQTVAQSRIKNPVKYDLLKKAIVTEKNLITAGGKVEISGDVLSFGSVPVVDDTLPPTERVEDQNASWNRYGGILVGMCQEMVNVSEELDFDANKTGDNKNGSLTINGSAATMAYIHTVYSTSISKTSLTITGDSYARALRSEKKSNYSTISLNNLSTIDNLQIDSNASKVTINGVYKGFVDTWHAINGSGDTTVATEDELIPKRTSSVIVNGDSELTFNDAIYIGGSTFLKNIVDGSGYPYMTGISALKSTMRIGNAFMKDDISNSENKLFWYESGAYDDEAYVASTKPYSLGSNTVDMFSGREGFETDYFPLRNRAMHFKKVWTDLWSNDPYDIYSTYINPDNIILGDNAFADSGNIKGFSNGLIIANGEVYDSFDFDGYDPAGFRKFVQKPAIVEYYNQVDSLLSEAYDEDYPRLNFTAPTKGIKSYVDNDFVGTNRIIPNKPYVSSNTDLGFVYYGNADVEIKESGGNWYINSELMPSTKGIILVDGNIYVDSGFELTGIIMSSKNIVFLGNTDATTRVTYDQNTIDALLKADVNINGFFGLLTYEVPNETLKSQRISTKNTQIVKWNEIE